MTTFQIIKNCDILSNISSFLSLKDILCLSLTDKEIFNYRFSLLKNCLLFNLYEAEYKSSFLMLLFNSVMASSYHLTPSVPDIDNSVLITKLQAKYSILPVEMCEENLNNISSNFVLSEYFCNEKVSKKILKSITFTDIIITSNNWQNTVISLSQLYKDVFLALQGANEQLVDSLLSYKCVPCPAPDSNISQWFINTVSYICLCAETTCNLDINYDIAVVVRTVLIFHLFSFILWFCDNQTKLAKFGEIASVVKIMHEKALTFKNSVNRSKMPKYLKNVFNGKFEYAMTKIDNL